MTIDEVALQFAANALADTSKVGIHAVRVMLEAYEAAKKPQTGLSVDDIEALLGAYDYAKETGRPLTAIQPNIDIVRELLNENLMGVSEFKHTPHREVMPNKTNKACAETPATSLVKKLVGALKRMTMYSESLVDGNRDDYNWIVQAEQALTEAQAYLERQEGKASEGVGELALVIKPTEAMCDEARGFIMGLDLGIRNWQDMEKHLDRGGYSCIPYIREMAAQGQGGHITKWDVADCIWQLMGRAAPVPATNQQLAQQGKRAEVTDVARYIPECVREIQRQAKPTSQQEARE